MAVRMDAETAEQVRTRFREVSDDVEGTRAELRGLAEDVGSGAGEFAGLIAGAAHDFDGSWGAALDVFADSAGLIAGNTNVLYVNLARLDVDVAAGFDLSPR